MSPATRWSASARCNWWATSSRRRATETMVPIALATTDATSPSRDSRSAPTSPTMCSTPHAPPSARDDDREFGPLAGQDGEGRAEAVAVLVDARPRPWSDGSSG